MIKKIYQLKNILFFMKNIDKLITLQLSLKLQYSTEGNQLVHPYHHHKYIVKPKVIKNDVTKTDQMNSQK